MKVDFERERLLMIEQQIRDRGLQEPRLLEAMAHVLRHLFVPLANQHLAYADMALPIGSGQTISQPYIVALMTDLLALGGEEFVLEVGTGSGYQAAILGRLARQVHTVEIIPALAVHAKRLLQEYDNVCCHQGDGSVGWPSAAPYDRIVVTAAAPDAPNALLSELRDGGRMVVPVGGPGYQTLEVWTRAGDNFRKRSEIGVAFVPLRGEQGWPAGGTW